MEFTTLLNFKPHFNHQNTSSHSMAILNFDVIRWYHWTEKLNEITRKYALFNETEIENVLTLINYLIKMPSLKSYKYFFIIQCLHLRKSHDWNLLSLDERWYDYGSVLNLI